MIIIGLPEIDVNRLACTSHRVSWRGRRGAVPSVVFDLRGAEAYLQSVEHPEMRKRRWVQCIAGRRRKLVRNAG